LYKNYVELAKKFIGEHNNNSNWSPLDRIEMTAIIMFAEWLESNRLSLEKKEIFNNGNIEKRKHK
jgi:cytochrome c